MMSTETLFKLKQLQNESRRLAARAEQR